VAQWPDLGEGCSRVVPIRWYRKKTKYEKGAPRGGGNVREYLYELTSAVYHGGKRQLSGVETTALLAVFILREYGFASVKGGK